MPILKINTMSQPTTHYITITVAPGTKIRGKVVYVQPKTDRWHPEHALVHITSHDWLEAYGYAAEYSTLAKFEQGIFMPYRYRLEGDDYLYEGTFTTDRILAP